VIKKVVVTINPLWEGVKEPLRYAVFVGVSALITSLLDQVVELPQTELTLTLTLILRFVDKYLHENAKVEPKAKVTRLLPF
jgi:hypothetical protein